MKRILILILSLFALNVWAADTGPKFDCTLTDSMVNDKVGDAKATFTTKTPKIYYVCNSDTVTKGQNVKAVWIATDTNGVAPPNYKIDEKGIDVADKLQQDQVWTGTFSLSIPDKGWPAGSYRVELYVDSKLNQTAKFDIK